MAGCSSDSTRFSDPFSNPFGSASNAPVRHTASITPAIPAGRSPPIVSHSLSSGAPAMASNQPLRPQVMQAYRTPVSREVTGSIEPAGPGRVIPGAAFGGWTSSGGVPVTVVEGESAEVLSKRYGVPTNALLQTNGFHSASEIRPGSQITIPVYNATAGRQTAARVEPPHEEHVEPRRIAEVTPEEAKPVRVVEKREVEKQEVEKRVVEKTVEPKLPPRVERREVVARETEETVRTPAAKAKAAPERSVAKVVEPTAPRQAKVKEPVMAATKVGKAVPNKVVAEKTTPAKVVAEKTVPAKVVPSKLAQGKTVQGKKTIVAVAPPAPKAPAPAPHQEEVASNAVPQAQPAPAAPVTDPAGHPEFRWPARGRVIKGFTGNDGINIAVPEGTAVKAAEGGTVAYAGSELKGYGNLVLIRHPNGFVTAYANNGELDVKRGDVVKRGQVIAKSGQSGNVSSPQLHFELRKGSTPIDPTQYLAGL